MSGKALHTHMHTYMQTTSKHHLSESAKLRLGADTALLPTSLSARHLGGNLASTCSCSALGTLLPNVGSCTYNNSLPQFMVGRLLEDSCWH